MKEILKILSKYKFTILLIIILLITQAYLNLSLPSYTSNIVNTGIENSGITSIIPIKIRTSEFNKLLTYVDKENKNILISSFPCNSEYCTNLTNYNNTDVLYKPMSLLASNGSKDNLSESEIINYLKNEYTLLNIDINNYSISYISKTGFKMILIALLTMVVTLFNVYISSKVSAYFSRDLRQSIVNKIVSLESTDINNFSSASLITRCTNDVTQISNVITILLRIVLFAPILGIGAIMKVKSSPISWTIVISVIIVLLLMLTLFLVVVPKFKKFQTLLDRINLVSRETLVGLPVIRAFSNKKFENDKFDKANNDLTNNGLFIGTAVSIMTPTLTFIMNSIAILIIWVGSYEVNNYTMQVGDLIAFITYTMQIISSFLMLSMSLIMLPRSIVSIKRVSEILTTSSTIKEKNKPKKLKTINSIEFRDVYFRYPSAQEDVLRNINFKVTKGQTISFIGSTGSGKSTLINLIPRLFEVTSGSILINDIDIKEYKLKDIRRLIGFVPQKGKLFKGTILENLSFGQTKLDKNKIIESAKISESYNFINKNNDKFKRHISEQGSNVSGGERQRLSISRALAKDPDVLIFDDSFSALDVKTDSLVRKNLKKITKNKIVFIVTQRVSTSMSSDVIVVLDNGSIVGLGKDEDLSITCPIYKEIKSSQLGGTTNE